MLIDINPSTLVIAKEGAILQYMFYVLKALWNLAALNLLHRRSLATLGSLSKCCIQSQLFWMRRIKGYFLFRTTASFSA